MPGILGVINSNKFKKKLQKKETSKNIQEIIELENIYLERDTLPKFLNDKLFFETKSGIYALEGVVFNNNELVDKYGKRDWRETFEFMALDDPYSFFNEFRGAFSGTFYNKEKDETVVFVDHMGDKPIYYYEENGEVVFASRIHQIIKLMRKNDIDYRLDERGAYCLLTHGYMLEDITPYEGIKRLKAGSFLKITKEKVTTGIYHRLRNIPNEAMGDDEIIDTIDEKFRKAVERQYNKNKEYGYRDVAPLSAGLDSRMTTWVLNEYADNLLNVTYSQSNFLDETIPKEISSELKTDFLFKTLDNGLSLFYLDEMLKINSGVVLYGGPAQVWDSFNLLDHSNMGVIHTGMIGDVVVGTFYQSLKKEKKFSISDGAYSTFLFDSFKSVLGNYKIEEYENQEIFNFYTRGFNGANMGSPLSKQEFAESYSPFCDIDFMEFCLTIPAEKRWAHYIYDKWIIEKYPNAAKYPHNGRKIGKNKEKTFRLLGRDFTLSALPLRAFDFFIRKVGLKKNSIETVNHMNPFDYWYNTNEELKTFMDDYFSTWVQKVKSTNLKKDMKNMYQEGSVIEKTQVLTLLSVIKNYFENTEWLDNDNNEK